MLRAGEQRHDDAGDRHVDERQRAEREQDQPEQRRGEAERLALLARLQQFGEDRHERRASAACENRLENRFGICEAIVNAEIAPLVPKKLACTTSRAEPGDARQRRRQREDGGVEPADDVRRLAAAGRRPGGGWADPTRSVCCRSDHERAIVRAVAAVDAAAFSRHGQHPLTEEADPARGARAAREPPLHVHDQDLLPPARGRRRRGPGRRRRRPSTACWSGRSTRPSSEGRCTATTAPGRSLAQLGCAAALSRRASPRPPRPCLPNPTESASKSSASTPPMRGASRSPVAGSACAAAASSGPR